MHIMVFKLGHEPKILVVENLLLQGCGINQIIVNKEVSVLRMFKSEYSEKCEEI